MLRTASPLGLLYTRALAQSPLRIDENALKEQCLDAVRVDHVLARRPREDGEAAVL